MNDFPTLCIGLGLGLIGLAVLFLIAKVCSVIIGDAIDGARYPKPTDAPRPAPPPSPEEDWLHKTCRELDIRTDDVGSLPLVIPYRPITPPYVDEPRLRRTHDAHRYHRPPPPGMWD
jgi:hypothetical protein